MKLFFDTVDGEGAWARSARGAAAATRDNPYDDNRPGQGEPAALFEGDAESIRTPTCLSAAAIPGARCRRCWGAGEACSGLKDCDDPRHQPLDVRTGAARILRDRDGISGGVRRRAARHVLSMAAVDAARSVMPRM